MKLLKIGIAASAIIITSVSVGYAGSGTFKHSNGSKVKLSCNNSGCYQTQYDASGNKGKRTRIGPGGRSNYNKHKKTLKTKGYQ